MQCTTIAATCTHSTGAADARCDVAANQGLAANASAPCTDTTPTDATNSATCVHGAAQDATCTHFTGAADAACDAAANQGLAASASTTCTDTCVYGAAQGSLPGTRL